MPEGQVNTLLAGCDFSSAPTRRKPIVVALGLLHGHRVQLTALLRMHSLQAFAGWLARPAVWVCAFDFPFGLPRELVQQLGWPVHWQACIEHYGALSRAEIRARFAAFCNSRPAGSKFAHRATDRPAGSSPSMKWVNPPVAYMLHAGVPLLLRAGVTIAGLHEPRALPGSDPGSRRVALEGYPGLLARELIGRASYKSDTRKLQTTQHREQRERVIGALVQGHTRLELALVLDAAQRLALLQDGSGDALDAVLCLVQAAWAQRRHSQGDLRYGLPADMDPLEGWIITA